MARGVNKVILIGNLGKDPEVRYSPNGGAIANITLATSESWKDKNTGEQVDKTEWHRVVFFRRLAEIAGEYLKKGSKVFIEGKLQTRKWQDKDGQDRYTTEIVANEMQMLDSKGGGSAEYNQGQQQGGYAPQQQAAPQQAQQQSYAPQGQAPQQQSAPAAPAMSGGDFDDDIPF